MAESVVIRPLDLLENEQILAATHSIHFAGTDSSAKRASYVSWLLANPVKGSIYLGAYVDGMFASFLGFMAREVVGHGHVFRAALAFGAMTVPQFRGRGLYKRLAHAGWEEARRAGFHFALGYTIRPYVLDLELRMGWSKLVAAPVMAFPLNMSSVLRAALPRLAPLASMAAPLSPLARAIGSRLAGHTACLGYALTSVEGFSAECDNLTARLRQHESFTFSKDRRALEWLYLSPHNPFDYDIIEARKDGILIGFAVGRRMDLLGLNGYGILDLIVAPGHEAVLRLLAAQLIRLAMPAKPDIIGALVSAGHPAQRALRLLGFIDTRRSFTLIFRPTQDDLPAAVLEPEKWCNFWGNNDTV